RGRRKSAAERDARPPIPRPKQLASQALPLPFGDDEGSRAPRAGNLGTRDPRADGCHRTGRNQRGPLAHDPERRFRGDSGIAPGPIPEMAQPLDGVMSVGPPVELLEASAIVRGVGLDVRHERGVRAAHHARGLSSLYDGTVAYF